MTEATTTRPVDSFLDPDTVECPFPMYERLLEDKPVYIDPISGFYIISRFEDARRVLLAPQVFTSGGVTEKLRDGVHPERSERMRDIYRRKGWLPGESLGLQDEPRHGETRAIFDAAFRASRIRELDPAVRDEAYALVEGFADAGGCDVVSQYAIPLPLNIIGMQMGVAREELPQIKAWTEAWMRRLSLLQTEEQEVESIEAEIEAQHFFKKKFDALRAQPNNSLLSDLVNTPRSDGSRLSDAELCGHIMADTFVGGSETTTSALASAVRILCEDPALQAKLRTDPENQLRTFIEEVLRVESPVQGLYRMTTEDVTIQGVTIPKRSVVNVRYAAANRDPAQFENPECPSLERRNAGSHLAFGSGIHACVGATLARRELYWGLHATLDRLKDLRLAPGVNSFKLAPSLMLRRLAHLQIEYAPA